MFGKYEKEVNTLVNIMKRAIPMTIGIQKRLDFEEVRTKKDGTYVSIADYAIQSIIMDGIFNNLPGDDCLGEEDCGKLNPYFLSMVKKVLPDDFDPVKACHKAIFKWGPDNHRVWVIDPIDGTAGFVSNGAYAIATALLIDMKVACSITAWPLHDPQYTGLPFEGPAIFIATDEGLAVAMDMEGNTYDMTKPTCHESGLLTNGLGRVLAVIKETFRIDNIISMVSMVKGFILASGKASVYARIHKMQEHVWDVAPFELFVRNCGGYVTDGLGHQLVYLPNGMIKDTEYGILSTIGRQEFHDKVLATMREGMKNILQIDYWED
ncbi:Inositol monophosphatase family protein [Trichomonas vaginalis G3]|uniref:Inositol monophosphatase family protein n=1 Tax=Trichomonas vaginalis (strain ATCC PRA-98 / G3) TaxID=412133 RepID=A2G1B9_TRIV3|nr:3'(2'),5'-bisphosphate nucleotidase protein [Trichomonas vaginalis G3]EAX89052.1 Inositol monophosphatase family protein [Trichomonas vaginalis G3]KAI5547340.1 3'(2'),5'-bisphosphate nucleotidase protein [Trichomonas vaginalis G3]|eukprot:XP_001301982.1 Inositol monophosphatase family protein [Trichomonas vaginalis G3]